MHLKMVHQSIMKSEEKEKDRTIKKSMKALDMMTKIATTTLEDETKRKLKLADIKLTLQWKIRKRRGILN